MSFWGVQVSLDKTAVYVPPPEQAKLRLSQATLSLNAASGEKVALVCKSGADEIFICSLREGACETINLDLVLDSYTEFSLAAKAKQSKASIHLAGYLIPEEEEMEEDDEDEEGLQHGMGNIHPDQLEQMMGDDSEEDSEEDYEDDSDSEEEEPMERTSSVVIEDITDQEEAKDAAGKKVTATAKVTKEAEVGADKKGKAKVKPSIETIVKEIATEPALAEEEDDEDAAGSSDSEEESEEEMPESAQEPQPKAASAQKRKAQEQAANGSLAEASKQPAGGKKKAKLEASLAAAQAVTAPEEKPMKGKKTFPNGFVIENVSMGDPAGKLAKAGKKVLVKYVGKLQKTGKIFDQTKGNKPFTFRLGVNEVIKGWDQGVVGMRVGDKRKLTIPPQMGYGAKGIPNVIPGNATLLFDVELVDVK